MTGSTVEELVYLGVLLVERYAAPGRLDEVLAVVLHVVDLRTTQNLLHILLNNL